MAHKMVRVRYCRTMGVGKEKRGPGHEVMVDEGTAARWLANGRVEIVPTGKEAARPLTAADPTSAPPGGSPAGSGAASSSSRRGRPPRTLTLKASAPASPPLDDVNPFG